MRLIDADELIKKSFKMYDIDELGYQVGLCAVPVENINNAPTIRKTYCALD